MLTTSLTSSRIALPDGGSAIRYPWNGESVLIRDDAYAVIRCIEILSDDKSTKEYRQDEFLSIFFPDGWFDAYTACDYSQEEFKQLIDSAVWDVCGIDLSGSRTCEAPLWDFEEDAARIRTSFRQAYGIEWDEVRETISFVEFIALIGGCPQDTPLGQAIHYRNPKTRPKPTKHNRKEIQQWDRAHSAYALKKTQQSSSRKKGQDDTGMRDAFLALKRAAR